MKRSGRRNTLPGAAATGRPKRSHAGIWLVSFMHYDLGYIDLEQGTLQTIDNPFGTRLSPMSQVQTVTHVSGPYKEKAGRSGRIRTCDPLIPNHKPVPIIP